MSIKMADTNRSQAVATVSIEQAMSSIPPQLGPGGHPRYSQHSERERPGGPALGYGGPPPPSGSYGNSYSSYPPPPYGSSMHGNYGAGPIPGVPPPGYPRAGYSVQPPHASAYGPGYGPGPSAGGFPQSVHHPPYYGGGYESHYGGQPPPGHPSHQQALQSSYRGASPIPSTSTGGPGSSVLRGPNNGLPTAPLSSDQHSLLSAGSALLSKNARSPPGSTKANHGATAAGGGKSSSSQQSPETTQQYTLPDHGEVERLRAAAATEITTEEVKPIQTDFHFFVKEHIGTHRKLAEEEVRSGMEDKSEKLDSTIVNSNLNTRLMKAWEGLTKEGREAYMVQEEADRRRFMEDDEIASRHCATLTARGKSPRVAGSDNNEELAQQQQKVKKEPQQQEDDNAPKPVVNAPIKDEAKRSAPESTGEAGGASDMHGSPSKKNKAG
jgi:hypothetical protein